MTISLGISSHEWDVVFARDILTTIRCCRRRLGIAFDCASSVRPPPIDLSLHVADLQSRTSDT
eukprot:4799400-Pyramimonas_sp.AAC.1